jgi:hypothetical protein
MQRTRLPSFASVENLVVHDEPAPPDLPEDVGALRLLQMVYRGELKVSPQQMRAAIESLPFEAPKLTAIALSSMTAQDFASRLDRAVERSEKARLIEGKVISSTTRDWRRPLNR